MNTPVTPNNDAEGSSVRPGAASNLPPPPARRHAFGSTLQLLALCPLLAVSDTVVKALGFGALVLVIFPLATVLLGAIRRWLDDSIVLPGSLLVTAGLVTAAELVMRAWFHDLGASFGVFLPLLAVNIVVIDHLQTTDRGSAVIRSVRIALGIALTLIALGLARELVGRGSLLSGAGALLGTSADRSELKVFSLDMGFLLALLPPGAFISLGLLIAARNWMTSRKSTPS